MGWVISKTGLNLYKFYCETVPNKISIKISDNKIIQFINYARSEIINYLLNRYSSINN